MGVCCSFNKNSEAEDFVITQIKSEVLKLNEFDYNKLLNEIVSKRVQQEIYKEHIEEYLLEEFYNTSLPENEIKYQKAILEHLISLLNKKNNMYVVMLIFYPFINHTNENCDENLYSMFNYAAGRLTIEELEIWLKKYFNWFTFEITKAVLNVCDDPIIKNGLEELNISFYNGDAIKNIVDKMLSEYKKNSQNPGKDLISKEQFKSIYQANPFASVEQIRNLVSNFH
jgi:hypothetical protein